MDMCNDRARHYAAGPSLAVLRGESTAMTPERALTILAASDHPNRVRDVEAIIADEQRPLDLRVLAAERLGHMRHPAVPDALLRHLDCSEVSLRRRIVRGLSLAGDRRALQPLLTLARQETSEARDRAIFAAGVIEHRLQCEATHLRCDEIDIVPAEPCAGIYTAVSRPSPRDVEACILDTANDLSGFQYDAESALEIRIDFERWILLLDSRFRDVAETGELASRCALFGLVAEWDPVSTSYSSIGLVLSSPDDGAGVARLRLYDPDGALLAIGEAPCVANRGALSLRTVTRDLGFTFALQGELVGGNFRISRFRAGVVDSVKRLATGLPVSLSA